MKKIGITCRIHVSQAVQRTAVRMWEVVNVLVASRQGAAASQRPTITTDIDIAREEVDVAVPGRGASGKSI